MPFYDLWVPSGIEKYTLYVLLFVKLSISVTVNWEAKLLLLDMLTSTPCQQPQFLSIRLLHLTIASSLVFREVTGRHLHSFFKRVLKNHLSKLCVWLNFVAKILAAIRKLINLHFGKKISLLTFGKLSGSLIGPLKITPFLIPIPRLFHQPNHR